MLRFLSALFASPEERAGGVDEALLEKAIERAVQGTDPRLRALGDYRKRLRQPVEQAVAHAIALVDALPAPVPIGAQSFGDDPMLRLFFASAEHLREVCGGFHGLRDYLAKQAEPLPAEIFGLLSMAREERNVFAMELDGDTLRRDVPQVAVNFFNHRYLGTAGSEAEARWELKKRAFDYQLEKALEQLTQERGKRLELGHQRHLLQRKLDAMRAGDWGLGALPDAGNSPDLAALEAEIQAIEEELLQFQGDKLGLEESLERVADTLSHPADWMAVREIRLCLDYRGIKQAAPTAGAREVTLTELFSCTGERRTVLFGRIARAELPTAADFWKTAKRYL